MKIEDTPLAGLKVVTPDRHGDTRGFFSETWNARRMADAGLAYDFVQDNHSLSAKRGTLRGLHYQSPPHAQAKLVRCGRGRLWDVAVDARRGSATYGQWYGCELSFENARQLLIPTGFLHGFVTLTDDVEIVYKCSDFYAPECDGAVHWDSCGITWPNEAFSGTLAIVSDKDAQAQPFADFDSPFTMETAA